MIGLALTPNLAPPKAWWLDDTTYAADFVRGKYMKNRAHASQSAAFTFTRTSEKLAQTLAGSWKLFASDVPAITDRGLSCEPEETFYPVNALLEGAVPGVLGSGGALPTNWTALVLSGLSLEVVHVGMHGDAPYIRFRIFGTATGTDFQIALNADTQTAAAGETWTTALFVRHAAGDASGMSLFVRLVEEANGVYIDASSQGIGLGSAFERSILSRVLVDGSVTNVRTRFRLTLPAPQATDVMLDLMMPTLVKSAGTGTPMLTAATGQSVRAKDNATLLLPSSAGDLALQLADQTSVAYTSVMGEWPVPETLPAPILSAQLS